MKEKRVENRSILLLILLIAAVFMLGIFAGSKIFYTGKKEPVKKEKEEALPKELLNLLDKGVVSVELGNSNGTMLFLRDSSKKPLADDIPQLSGEEIKEKKKTATESSYILFQPELNLGELIDKAQVQTFVQSLLSVRYSDKIETNPEDKENNAAEGESAEPKTASENASDGDDFGFSKPSAIVTYKTDDGSVIQLYVGRVLDDKSSAYVKLHYSPSGSEESKKDGVEERHEDYVYVALNIVPKVLRGPLSLLSSRIECIPGDQVKTLRIADGSDNTELVFKVADDSLSGENSYSDIGKREWKLSSPFIRPAKSSEINSLVRELQYIYPQSYPEYGEIDDNKYGFDKALYTVELSSDYDSCTLYIGGEAEKGKRFAKLSKYPLVFILQMTGLSNLKADKVNFIEKHLISVKTEEIQSLWLKFPGAELQVEQTVLKNTGDKKVKFVMNGEEKSETPGKDEEQFLKLLKKLTNLEIDGIDSKIPANRAPEISAEESLSDESADDGEKTEKPSDKGKIYAFSLTLKPGSSVEQGFIKNEDGSLSLRLLFFERDENSFYIEINGEPTPFYISADKISGGKSVGEGPNNSLAGFVSELLGKKGGETPAETVKTGDGNA